MEKMYLCVSEGYNVSNARYIHYESSVKRTLIYAAKPPKGYHVMKPEEWRCFTEGEKCWAMKAGHEINKSALNECGVDNAEFMNAFCDVLEQELQKAQGDTNG